MNWGICTLLSPTESRRPLNLECVADFRVSDFDVLQRGESDDLILANEDPLAIGPDTVSSGIDDVQFACGFCVSKVVNVGIGQKEIAVVLSDESSQNHIRALQIENDFTIHICRELGRIGSHKPV